MARAFYPNELQDRDLDWLFKHFFNEKPNYLPVEESSQPIVLIPKNNKMGKQAKKTERASNAAKGNL